MASEMSGGYRRVDRTSIRSADEYYKSNDQSTVAASAVHDSAVAKARSKPQRRRVDRTTVRSADEYYAEQPTEPARRDSVAPTHQPNRRPEQRLTGPLVVKDRAGIPAALDRALDILHEQPATLVLLLAAPALTMHLRSAIDGLVTRGLLGEEQRAYLRVQTAVPTAVGAAVAAAVAVPDTPPQLTAGPAQRSLGTTKAPTAAIAPTAPRIADDDEDEGEDSDLQTASDFLAPG